MSADRKKPVRQVEEVHVVFAASPAREQLRELAAWIREHRDPLLDAWRAYGDAVPGRNIAASLSRVQLNDHIPTVLESLSATLEAWPENATPITGEAETEEMSGHGLQRWQQGYSLSSTRSSVL